MKIIPCWTGVVLVMLMPVLAGAVSPQHDDGVVGMTRKNGNGCACHSLSSSPGVQVWVSGPAVMQAGSGALFTVTMVGGPAVSGGFDVAAGNGALLGMSSDELLIAGELTHAAPKPFVHDTVRWNFSYRAPAAQGHDTIYAVGQSVNGNGLPDNGDQWNYSANFAVAIVASSAPLPALSEWGIVLLILGVVAGAHHLLTRRTRPARIS